jgi:hypothetical protein
MLSSSAITVPLPHRRHHSASVNALEWPQRSWPQLILSRRQAGQEPGCGPSDQDRVEADDPAETFHLAGDGGHRLGGSAADQQRRYRVQYHDATMYRPRFIDVPVSEFDSSAAASAAAAARARPGTPASAPAQVGTPVAGQGTRASRRSSTVSGHGRRCRTRRYACLPGETGAGSSAVSRGAGRPSSPWHSPVRTCRSDRSGPQLRLRCATRDKPLITEERATLPL